MQNMKASFGLKEKKEAMSIDRIEMILTCIPILLKNERRKISMLNKRILTLVFVVAFLTLLVGCFLPPIEENQPPIITSDPVETATVGVDYTYHVKATDPDGDTLTYSLTVSPKDMTIKPTTGIINWDPQIKDVGYHEVTVVISDRALSVVQTFTINVYFDPWVDD